MSDKTQLRLKLPVMIALPVLLGLLSACGAVEGLIGGGEVLPPPTPTTAAEFVAEAESFEPEATDTPEPTDTGTPPFGAGTPTDTTTPDGSATPEGTPGEATPTRVAPLGGTPGTGTPSGTPGTGTPTGTPGTATPTGTAATPTATPSATPQTQPQIQPQAQPQTAPASGAVTYTVKAGDTLGEIAQAFGTTVAEIVNLNAATYPSLATDPNRIEIGWVLTMPAGTLALYTVKQSDVLELIAERHGTTVEVLISLNEATYPSLRTEPWKLQIGWVLKVPPQSQ